MDNRLTDLENAIVYFKEIRRGRHVEFNVAKLNEVLDKAQNGPPDGHGDNTIGPVVWKLLGDFTQQIIRTKNVTVEIERRLDLFRYAPPTPYTKPKPITK